MSNSSFPTVTVSRRTMLKSAAWSAPVLAAATAVPFAAASDPVEPAPRFDVEIRENSHTSSSATGNMRFFSNTGISAGTVLTITINPDTSGGRMFQVQRNSDSDYLDVPLNGSGSANGTTKLITVSRNLNANERAFVNFNFSGYISSYRPITVSVFDGQTLLASRTWN